MRKRSCGCFSASLTLLKRVGKPTDTPPYKQAYLPYDQEPTPTELEAARKPFMTAYAGAGEHRKLIPVKDVPQNMYTYGKEGMSLPISIFKGQDDPVIGPEWSYPGIYENKLVARHWHLHELFDRERRQSFESPWLKDVLNNQVKRQLSRVAWRMSMLNLKAVDVFQKERGASKRQDATKEPPAKK